MVKINIHELFRAMMDHLTKEEGDSFVAIGDTNPNGRLVTEWPGETLTFMGDNGTNTTWKVPAKALPAVQEYLKKVTTAALAEINKEEVSKARRK